MARLAARRAPTLLETLGGAWRHPVSARLRGTLEAIFGFMLILAFGSYNAADPSLNAASADAPTNLLGRFGATAADLGMQSLGLTAWLLALVMIVAGVAQAFTRHDRAPRRRVSFWAGLLGLLALSGVMAAPEPPAVWPLARGLGGFWGDEMLGAVQAGIEHVGLPQAHWIATGMLAVAAALCLAFVFGLKGQDLAQWRAWFSGLNQPRPKPAVRRDRNAPLRERVLELPDDDEDDGGINPLEPAPFTAASPASAAAPTPRVHGSKPLPKPSNREAREVQGALPFAPAKGFRLPELGMLAKPKPRASEVDEGALLQNARLLEGVLAEFSVNGRIDQIRPGPVVTMYELVPAAGVKTARVVALADDIARSMSVISCRVSVASGRNAIGIELPNARRETVYLRDLLSAGDYERTTHVLPLALGETINGEPYIADLARMPHLLIAGTTGSGKSVGVNAMILSILYRLGPEECRLIMIDRESLELAV